MPDTDLDRYAKHGNLQGNSRTPDRRKDFRAVREPGTAGIYMACFDMRKGCWDDEMCGMLDIPRRLLPELMLSHRVAGRLTKEAAEQTGLAEGTPVVAGGLDAACGTLGAGVVNPGQTQEQGGQAGGMSICIDRYAADPRLILGFHVVP